MVERSLHTVLPILSWILTRFFKKKVTVTAFNRDHYTSNVADGYIDIYFDALVATDRELLYKVLCLVRETLAQGTFVADSVFGHANVSAREGNYIWKKHTSGLPVRREETDDKLPFEWSKISKGKLPFEWTNHIIPEDDSEDSLRCTETFDDTSIACEFTLKYSIEMDEKICKSDYEGENCAPHLIYDHLELLREDVETLWGKSHQQTDKICESLQGMRPYEIDLFRLGQDIFISASIVREIKEGRDLCTAIIDSMEEILKVRNPRFYYKDYR